MTRTLIVTADDLGITESVNLAVREAHETGIVTGASLMANMPAFEHAVTEILPATPGLGVGAHLCITSGRPCTAPDVIPHLVDRQGRFRHSFAGLMRLLLSKHRRQVLRQIELEIGTQLERLLEACPQLDHIDGHQHVHMLPGVRRLVAGMAQEHNLVMRVPHERWRAFPATISGVTAGLPKAVALRMCSLFDATSRPESGLHTNYVGLFESGRLDAGAWCRILNSLPPGVTEINTHPGSGLTAADVLECSEVDREFLTSSWRQRELEALSAPAVRAECERNNVTLATFADLTFANRGLIPN